MLSWLFSGKFEKLPNLKIALSEGEIGWIPYFLERDQQVYDKQRYWVSRGVTFDVKDGAGKAGGDVDESVLAELDIHQLYLDHIRQACDLYATLPDEVPSPRPLADSVQANTLALSAIRYEPVGVVSAISAFNAPFWINVWRVIPALLTGNTVVLRPSPYTPLSALILGFVRSLALEVARDGVRLNCISPSFVEGTPIWDRFSQAAGGRAEKSRQRAGLGLPTAYDVAALVLSCAARTRRKSPVRSSASTVDSTPEHPPLTTAQMPSTPFIRKAISASNWVWLVPRRICTASFTIARAA